MSFLRNPGKRMRRAAALLLVLVFALSRPPAAAFAAGELTEGEELLKNGDFSDPLLFQLYKESGGAAAISIVDGQLQVDVSAIGRVAHAIQPYYDGFGLVQGVEYELSYDVRSTLPRELYVRVQLVRRQRAGPAVRQGDGRPRVGRLAAGWESRRRLRGGCGRSHRDGFGVREF